MNFQQARIAALRAGYQEVLTASGWVSLSEWTPYGEYLSARYTLLSGGGTIGHFEERGSNNLRGLWLLR